MIYTTNIVFNDLIDESLLKTDSGLYIRSSWKTFSIQGYIFNLTLIGRDIMVASQFGSISIFPDVLIPLKITSKNLYFSFSILPFDKSEFILENIGAGWKICLEV